MRNISYWVFLSDYINSHKNGDTINRKDIIKSFHKECADIIKRQTSTLDGFIGVLKRIRVLETEGLGKYKKLQYIPHGLKSTKARQLGCEKTWKSWFIKLEDRL